MGCSKIQYKPGVFMYLVVLLATFFHASNEFAHAKDSNQTLIPDSDHNDYSGEYEYDYDYPNPCDIDKTAYDSSSDDNDNCLHTDFMNIPIVNELPEYSNATKFKPCCEMGPNTKHGYLHNDQCEERDTHTENLVSHPDSLRLACGAPKTQPMHSKRISCPLDCKMIKGYMNRLNLTVHTDGSKTIDELSDVKVHDFCVGYHCGNDATGASIWEVIAKTCICFEQHLWNRAYAKLAKIDFMFSGNESLSNKKAENAIQSNNRQLNNLQSCCKGNSSVIRSVKDISHPEFSSLNDSYIFCAEPSNEPQKAENRFCESGKWNHMEISDKGYEIKNENGKIVISKNGIPKPSLDVNSNYYCVGVGISHLPVEIPHKRTPKPVAIIKTCVPPCRGKTPCIRLCTDCRQITTKELWIKEIKGHKKFKDEKGMPNSKCLKLKDDTAETFYGDSSESLIQNGTHLVDSQPSMERICPEGFIAKRLNEPACKKCLPNCTNTNREDEKFDLIDDTLVILNSGRSYRTDQFCIHPNPDAESKYNHFATVCVEITESWTPYFLIASSIFLLLTVAIYTWLHKLLNFYSRIMRHFALALFAAFIALAIVKLTNKDMVGNRGCQALGFMVQYFFLVAFALMTTMCLELWITIRGFTPNKTRYRRMMLVGYLSPTIIVIMTMITEKAAPECASLKPRIGDNSCFFAEWSAKFFWFHFPMAIALIINTCVYIAVIHTLCQSKRQVSKMLGNLTSQKNRSENAEKFLTYTKLFLGFGFMWTFEIISGLAANSTSKSDWYFTDVMNMLQPLYVFAIFVLKRNVIRMILGTDKKSRQSKARSQRVRIGGKSYQRATKRESDFETPTVMTRLSSKNEQAIEMQSLDQD